MFPLEIETELRHDFEERFVSTLCQRQFPRFVEIADHPLRGRFNLDTVNWFLEFFRIALWPPHTVELSPSINPEQGTKFLIEVLARCGLDDATLGDVFKAWFEWCPEAKASNKLQLPGGDVAMADDTITEESGKL